MTTVLIWLGSGFAFTAGMLVGMRLMRLPQGESVAIANQLLRERNEIGRQQVAAIERIATAIETTHGKLTEATP